MYSHLHILVKKSSIRYVLHVGTSMGCWLLVPIMGSESAGGPTTQTEFETDLRTVWLCWSTSQTITMTALSSINQPGFFQHPIPIVFFNFSILHVNTLCVYRSDVRNLERKKRFLLTLLLILLFLKSMLSLLSLPCRQKRALFPKDVQLLHGH